MTNEVLTVAQSYAADRYAAEHGVPTLTLMANAGRAVADEILRRWPLCSTLVLCGGGDNGGDGYVVARLLSERGWPVRLASVVDRNRLKGDAATMAARWSGDVVPLSPDCLADARLVVDAMFGAGLARPLEGAARETANALNASMVSTVAVDLPSGLHGDLGRAPEGPEGVSVQAELTVTFFRKKPAHVLMPGRLRCGEVVVAD
ncbi:MAG TPA: NAD(P)H-hydrate epimerase, partial [Rhizomicrobium sp.]